MINNIHILNKLQNIELKKSNIEVIRKLILGMQLPIVKSEVVQGSVVVRARTGRGYRDKDQMSYKPAKLCTTIQRATLPNQTVFYGTLSDDRRLLENARAIGVSECSKLTSEGIDSVGKEYITTSQWIVREPISVACITAKDYYNGVSNRLLDYIKTDFINTFSSNIEAIKLSDFIANEFSKVVENGHNEDYIISAIITDLLLNVYGFEAVAYPSVKLCGQAGLNIAIRPDVADEKLELLSIAEQCLYKNIGKSYVRLETIYENDGNIISETDEISDELLCKEIGVSSLDEFPEV